MSFLSELVVNPRRAKRSTCEVKAASKWKEQEMKMTESRVE